MLPKEQASFRSGRNCCEQVLALTIHVENGFQEKLKSEAVFFRGLLLKLVKILKFKTTLRLLEQTLSNRNFKIRLNGEVSRRKVIQHGLPQGSVLSPTLFNVYTADITKTRSRKFMYADDIGLLARVTHLNN